MHAKTVCEFILKNNVTEFFMNIYFAKKELLFDKYFIQKFDLVRMNNTNDLID